jgi:hypothetical protein
MCSGTANSRIVVRSCLIAFFLGRKLTAKSAPSEAIVLRFSGTEDSEGGAPQSFSGVSESLSTSLLSPPHTVIPKKKPVAKNLHARINACGCYSHQSGFGSRRPAKSCYGR